mmetsp:Transcript_116525/g.290973  ORF Transcript_116525/g.290973 Transcript_116525/m.290973 type:complete len:144 (+) Transcript_116525:89-520(+)
MPAAAADLVWECIKGNNAFIRKSPNMPVMSAEPGNLCGLNSFKFSGLASKKVLDVSVKKAGLKETIVMTMRTKNGSKAQRPGRMLVETGLKKNAKKGLAQVAKATGGALYRRDLQELAEKKYAKVKTSLKKRKPAVKSRRAPK